METIAAMMVMRSGMRKKTSEKATPMFNMLADQTGMHQHCLNTFQDEGMGLTDKEITTKGFIRDFPNSWLIRLP
jgi:hypothetical protein